MQQDYVRDVCVGNLCLRDTSLQHVLCGNKGCLRGLRLKDVSVQHVRIFDVLPWELSLHNICERDFWVRDVCVRNVTAEY